jgi:hypothetical protein
MDNKKANPATESALINAQTDNNKNPVRLTPEQTEKLVNLLSPRANTARRMVKLLAAHPDSITGDINRVSTVNLGHIKRVYNPILSQAGYLTSQKKTQKTAQHDVELARERFKEMIRRRTQ